MTTPRWILLLPLLLFCASIAGGGPPAPARTAQRLAQLPSEPPLADLPPVPQVGEIPPAPPPDAPGSPSPQPEAPALEPEGAGVCPGDPPTPAVSLRVRVAATASAGQELEYRLCVANQSPAAAHHVTIRNPVPANARYVRATPAPVARDPEIVWRLGTLQPGQCRELVLVLRPTGGDISCCARVAFEHGQCVTTRIGRPARPALSLRKTGPSQVVLYDPVTYRLEVRNTGPTSLTDVVLTDLLPPQLRYDGGNPAPEQRSLLTWNLGTLAPGEQRVIEYRALTTEEGTFSNRAAVTAAGGLREEATSRLTVGKSQLSLTMIGPERRYANLPAAYELTVSNPGNAPVANVTVANPVPAGTKLVSAGDDGRQVENEVRWVVGTLAPGAKKTLRLELAADMPGEVVNRATAKADRDLSARAEVKTLFQGVAGLTAKLTGPGPVEVGQEVAYVLVVKNTGTDSAGDVKVTATVPAQLQATDAQGPAKAMLQADKVTYEPVALKAGEEIRYLIYVKALKAGDVRFRVDIEAKELSAGPVREEAGTTIFEDPGR